MARHLSFTNTDKRKRPYWRDERLLGRTFVDKQQEGILAIGKDVWTRQEIVEQLRCGNFVAAQNLTKIARKLDVDSLEQLTSRFTIEDLFGETGFGITTMYVLMCAQEARNKNPIQWLDRKPDALVTLTTEKHRAIKHLGEAQAARKKDVRSDRRRAG